MELIKYPFVKGIHIGEDFIEIHVDMSAIHSFENILNSFIGTELVKDYSFRTAYLGDIYEKVVSARIS